MRVARVAPAPLALIPKGLASEGLLAFIATAKFCDALPLYRQERQFARLGVELSRRTMSDSMIAVAAACEPLLELLLERLRSEPKLQIDETTVQVLKEPGRDNTTVSYVCVARGGPPETPTLVYRYEPSRGAWVADASATTRASCRPTAMGVTSARAADPASCTWAVGRTYGALSKMLPMRRARYRTGPSLGVNCQAVPHRVGAIQV